MNRFAAAPSVTLLSGQTSAVETSATAAQLVGDETLCVIARELVETVRRNITIDWPAKDSARAKLTTLLRRIERKHGYPRNKPEKAKRTVLEQAEVLCKDWAA
jgi:type I restriction enzyme R subunit